MTAHNLTLSEKQTEALVHVAAHGNAGTEHYTARADTLKSLAAKGLIEQVTHHYARGDYKGSRKVWRATELGWLWYVSRPETSCVCRDSLRIRTVVANAYILVRASVLLANQSEPYLTYDPAAVWTALKPLESLDVTYIREPLRPRVRDVRDAATEALRAALRGDKAVCDAHLEDARKVVARQAAELPAGWDSYSFRHYTGLPLEDCPLFKEGYDALGYTHTTAD